MLDYESALAHVLTEVPLLASERVLTTDALGRVLRAPLVSACPIPRFESSAMDGYAVRASDCEMGVELPVFGEARTGQEPQQLEPHAAMRIFTGAALPLGADAVIMQERVQRHDRSVELRAPVRSGDNVRHAGEDLTVGSEALPAGTRVTPGAAMLAASLDQLELLVAQRPRVTILCTGDELRAAGTQGRVGMIPESNSPGLRALAEQACANVVLAPLVADEPHALEQALQSALQRSDLLVTIGGVSVGDHDYVRSALQACGVEFDFWKVSIKPGKPVAFGRTGRHRVLALPGNPASAAAVFALFGMPLLRAMQGDTQPLAVRCMLACDEPVRRNKERLTLSLGRSQQRNASSFFVPHANQSSGATLALAQSNGMALVPAGDGYCDRGTPVEFMFWSLM